MSHKYRDMRFPLILRRFCEHFFTFCIERRSGLVE